MEQKNKSIVKEFSTKSAAIDIGKRQIRFLASTPDVDRDGERILPTAFEPYLTQFMTNPCVLCSHQHHLGGGEPPVVGRAVKIWTDSIGLWVIIEFALSELAQKYFELYADGFMHAVSCSFIPQEWHNENINGEQVRTYTVVELIEISLCAVPSNRGALARSKANKLAFVEGKRQDQEIEKFLAEARQQDPEFDAKNEEFAEVLMTGNQGLGEIPETREIDYASLVKR
jgi:HK97 family phage prohead protease